MLPAGGPEASGESDDSPEVACRRVVAEDHTRAKSLVRHRRRPPWHACRCPADPATSVGCGQYRLARIRTFLFPLYFCSYFAPVATPPGQDPWSKLFLPCELYCVAPWAESRNLERRLPDLQIAPVPEFVRG